MNIGDKYERLEQVGVGWNQPMILNSFEIVSISNINVNITGKIASGLIKSRKINKIDFEKFLKNYKQV